MNKAHVLVVGCGSAGKRHARNLAALGCRISCVDPMEERRRELDPEMDIGGSYATIDEAWKSGALFDGVAVTSPPSVHVEQTITALQRRLPVMLEKPVSPTEKEARTLQEVLQRSDAPLLLAYTYRWWPPLARVRELLEQRAVGALRHVKFVMAAHLADWHPWEQYQDFFMASRELGGGALLDESHWIDLMVWFFGMPRKLFARIEKISDLEIDTDDNVDMVVSYDDGLRVTMHLDLIGRPHEKYIRFVGEEGTILWSMEPNEVAIARDWEGDWERTPFRCERNDMFVGAAEEFLDVLQGGPVRTCTLEDGLRVLEVVEAARRSSDSGREEYLSRT